MAAGCRLFRRRGLRVGWLVSPVTVSALAFGAALSIGAHSGEAMTGQSVEAHGASRCGAARLLLSAQSQLMNEAKGVAFMPQNFNIPLIGALTEATNDVCAGRFRTQACQTENGPPAGAFRHYGVVAGDWQAARTTAHEMNQPVWEQRFSMAMWSVAWQSATRMVPTRYLRWCDYLFVGTTAWMLDKWVIAGQWTSKGIAMLQRQPSYPLKSTELANAQQALSKIEHHLAYS